MQGFISPHTAALIILLLYRNLNLRFLAIKRLDRNDCRPLLEAFYLTGRRYGCHFLVAGRIRHLVACRIFGQFRLDLVMVQAAFLPSAVAVILAVPFFLAVTTPFELTVATLDLLVVHFTLRFVALEGFTVAFRVNFSFTPKVVFFRLKVTLLTAILFDFTVTLHTAVWPFMVLTVILAVPAAFAVTVPFWLTSPDSPILCPNR